MKNYIIVAVVIILIIVGVVWYQTKNQDVTPIDTATTTEESIITEEVSITPAPVETPVTDVTEVPAI